MLRSALILAAGLAFAVRAFAADETGPDGIVLRQHGHGWLLSDDRGMSLYTFERDDIPGKSNCTGACEKQWPPVLVKSTEQPPKGWSVVTREDGKKQWAFRGQPLYNYTGDVAPGDGNGDGVGNQWHLGFKPIPSPPGIKILRTLIGYVLADPKGLTLYALDKDKDGSGCDLSCTVTWIPLTAAGMAHPIAGWTLVTRNDGTKQWAYKGQPVYRYAGDEHSGETFGENAGKGWKAVVLEPPPPNPSWVEIHESDAGQLFTAPSGKTLYTHEIAQISDPQDWTPYFATDVDKPVGHWSIVDVGNGKKQWTYAGLLVFTNVKDKRPGDTVGIRSGDRSWQAIMRSSALMPGEQR